MKKTIKVQLHKSGSENDFLTRLVANVNEGKGEVSIWEILGYISCEKAAFPSIKSGLGAYYHPENNNIMNISEDGGKTFTMTLEFCEVYEIDKGTPLTQDEKDEIFHTEMNKPVDPELITVTQ